MIDFLKSWVISIITVVLFIVLIEIIIPSSRVKKFVNLISGLVILITIINPVVAYFNRGVNLSDLQIVSSNFIDKSEIERNSKYLNENQIKQVVEVYRQKIIRQVSDTVKQVEGVAQVQVEAVINEDYKSKAFGEVKKLYISIGRSEDGKIFNKVSTIKKVEIKIGGDEHEDKTIGTDNDIPGSMKKDIVSRVERLLGVTEENIIITSL